MLENFQVRTIVRVRDGRVRNEDVFDRIVIATADRADGDTMTAGARSTGERDVGAGVDGQTIILVLDVGAGNINSR